MPEIKDLSGAQVGIWLACLWFLVGLFNALTKAWGNLNGRDRDRLPDPLHTQEVTRYATEVDIRRIEERVRHLEESQTVLLNQIARDKTEIMEAASRGRAHINEREPAGIAVRQDIELALLLQGSDLLLDQS